MKKNIHEMKLHEVQFIPELDDQLSINSVIKVPGGWLYRCYSPSSDNETCTFVPYNPEFKT